MKKQGQNDAANANANANAKAPITNSTGSVPGISTGRIKAPPVCRVPALRKMNMSAEKISEWCFQPAHVLALQKGNNNVNGNSNGSSNSSDSGVGEADADANTARSGTVTPPTCTMDGNSTNVQNNTNGNGNGNNNNDMTVDQWADFKNSILQRTESRNGRDHQRFANDAQTGHKIRLTTGSVPIMRDGRILLISSSRKEEWILPKGGWESDERMEDSALRETYEEGGILGKLGPKLKEIDYETRKAKKRRLELESFKKNLNRPSPDPVPVRVPPLPVTKDLVQNCSSTASSVYHSEDDMMQGSEHNKDNGNRVGNGNENSMDVVSKLPLAAQKDQMKTNQHQECGNVRDRSEVDTGSICSTASFASDTSSSCGHVRLSMFPLYVLEVREHWPESGRARKVVDIDTAIEMMKSRPEFHQVLLEVKERGYHLKPYSRIHIDCDKENDT